MATSAQAALCNSNTGATTAFTAPSSCASYWTPTSGYTAGDTLIWLTRDTTVAGCAPPVSSECSASVSWYDSEYSTGRIRLLTPIFSPGVCPSGWKAANTGINDGVTTHICCPSEAETYRDDYRKCVNTLTNTAATIVYNSTSRFRTYSYESTTSNGVPTSTRASYTTSTRVLKTTELLGETIRFSMWPIQVEFRESEITPGPEPLPPGPDPIPPNPSGLSTGAKAGIGVGAGVVAIALLILAFVLYRRWKRKPGAETVEANDATTPEVVQVYAGDRKSELPADIPQFQAPSPPPAELGDGSEYRNPLPIR